MRIPAAIISLELKAPLGALLSSQQDDGGWEDDPLLTSYCLEALSITRKLFREPSLEPHVHKAHRFLYDWIDTISDKLQEEKEIYAELPTLLSQLGLGLSRIWMLEPIKDEDLKMSIKKSLVNVTNSCIKYFPRLSNPSAVANFLLSSVAFPSLLREDEHRQLLLDYVLNEMFSSTAVIRDRLNILLASAYMLQANRETRKLLQLSWERVRRRAGLTSFPSNIYEALKEIASSLGKQVKSEDEILSTLMCFRALVMLDPKDELARQASMFEMISEDICCPLVTDKMQLNQKLVPKKLILALTVLAIAESKFVKSIAFSWKDKDYLERALSTYDDWNVKKFILVTRSRYTGWLSLVSAMIGFWVAPIIFPGLLTVDLYPKIALLVNLVTALYTLILGGLRRPK